MFMYKMQLNWASNIDIQYKSVHISLSPAISLFLKKSFPVFSTCKQSLTTHKKSEYIFTSEVPLHLQSHSSLIFPGTSHSRLIVKDGALAPC